MDNAKNNKISNEFILNNNYHTIRLAVAFISAVIFAGLNLKANASSLNFTRHVYPQGLTQNSINDITQDQEGLIWLATRGGIHYYDGIRYTRLDLNSARAEVSTTLYESVFEDSQQFLWFGGFQGEVYRYNKFTGELIDLSKKIRTFVEMNTDLGFSGQIFVFSQVTQNQLWIGSEGGVVGLDLNTLNPFAISELKSFVNIKGITDIRKHKQNVWVATASGLIGVNLNNGKAHHFLNEPENSHSLSANRISKLLATDQALWIGTFTGGLNKMDYGDFRFIRYNEKAEPEHKIAAGKINDIILDRQGHVWIAQQSGGLHRYALSEKRFVQYQKNKGDNYSLSSNDIASLYQDKTGLIWIGTNNSGVNQYSETINKFRQLKSKLNNKN
ncbi:MAG: hypothetical protein OQK04_08700, partial [Kangiellaceae bacterium]|nr:hypothetical protein [Kangiellaceae bacterium]